MKDEYFDKLLRWFEAQRQRIRAQGMSEDALGNPAVVQSVWDAVMTKHRSEIFGNPEFLAAILEEVPRREE